mmetsp:Transcript_17104/g.36941  ORF Transcript_17104/g.36941 Transcript_17104/m.36941 type:complete len:415 (-) Transcript_17104:345-1589(-)|eukprot:CAMPEP_0172534866 /NCGR_PEP_ID=MMETSP1067-20121228/7087_1 /TAXON_ID=265564 ORGANISM="Thalassiosira punctigera, Strain Tpunct2005C2" /NCGR_SAMPLE_ID=MMETSP1067 /ASSEMBLY_ACC=CAM_ASM_000444 /LENGTH=414 /DNA_ID=CAMNT_0013319717 /DNA_START=494 /DNA_END=1738 /DNA_ORIENTATION=+
MVSFNEVAGNALLFFLVFGMSATVDVRTLVAQLKNARAILMGVFLQFAILPLCGFLVVKFFELERSVGISLLVVTSSPGGSYSNWWCSMFNADLALSVTMTAISTLLSVVLMPLNLLVYCKYAYEADVVQSLDFNSLFIALAVVISAIGLGLLASAKVHSYRFNILANKMGSYAGVSLVAYSALMSNTGGETQIWEHSWQFYVGVMLPCLLGLLVSNILTTFLSLKKPERVTLSVECCYQNVGIATSVALTMFKGNELSQAMAVPLYYGLVEALILGLYCIIAWKAGWTKAPKNVSFWTMVATSYEVLLLEHTNLKAVEVSLPKHNQDVNEKVNTSGDTIYVKYNVEEDDEDDYQMVSCMCITLPSHPKEASGCALPDVPESEYRGSCGAFTECLSPASTARTECLSPTSALEQ